jgi:drug/metabolite transporter (DMT)-like permease
LAQKKVFQLSDSARSWLILITLSMIWGSSFILIKKSLIAFSPQQVACLRIGISALAFFPFLAARFRRIDWQKWRYFLLVGVTGSAVPAFLFAFAQTQINSTMAGILNSLTPLFTLILGMFFFGSPFVVKKAGGVFLGLLGAILLILWSNEQGLSGHWAYALLVILATICYATSVNTVGSYLKGINSVTISAVSFSFMGLPALGYLFSTDFLSLMAHSPQAWASLGYVSILALFGTVLATMIFFYLVHLNNAVFASMIAYLIPIVAVFWGVIDGEPVSWMHGLGMILILSGIYLSRQKR